MKCDREPCPACGAEPPRTLNDHSHVPEVKTVDVSTRDMEATEFLRRLFFRCRRCGAIWPEDPERITMVNP